MYFIKWIDIQKKKKFIYEWLNLKIIIDKYLIKNKKIQSTVKHRLFLNKKKLTFLLIKIKKNLPYQRKWQEKEKKEIDLNVSCLEIIYELDIENKRRGGGEEKQR